MKETEGYIVIALGDKYKKLAEELIITLRKNKDEREVFIIDENVLDFNTELFHKCSVQYEKYHLYPKIMMDEYAPFDHNIYLDADNLCLSDTNCIWDYVKSQDQFILHRGLDYDHPVTQNWNKKMPERIYKKHGIKIPRIHGAFFYLNKNKCKKDFFNYLRTESWDNYDDMVDSETYNHRKDRQRKARSDQVMFAFAYEKFGLEPLDLYNSPIMTHITSKYHCNPPYYRVHFRDQYTKNELEFPVCFAHLDMK
jgi:hypothetical protein